MVEIKTYRDLIVWQKSMLLVKEVYELTKKYPPDELYGLTSQTRRASVSIPTNIAEGRTRNTKKDFRHFLVVAYSSGAELETEIEIAKMLNYAKPDDYKETDGLLLEVMKMLNSMLLKLRS